MNLRIVSTITVTLLLLGGGFLVLIGKADLKNQTGFVVANLPKLVPNIIEIKDPEPTSNELPAEEKFSLQFFGDTMLDRNVAKKMGNQGLSYLFSTSSENTVFANADFLFANLEGPFAKTRIKTLKEIAFRFDPKLADELKSFNFTAFSLANNHSYDMGTKNVTYTREVLREKGIGFFGDELKEGKEFTFFTTSSSGIPLAFIGLHNTYHELNINKVKEAVLDAKEKEAIIIASIHWGEEYKSVSNKKQQNMAHALVDYGVDVVIGHHPHVVQELEFYEGKPIFYSLGNFIFDQYFSQETQEGLSVKLSFSGKNLAEIELIPFYGEASKVSRMDKEKKEIFLDNLYKRSRLSDYEFFDGKLILEPEI